MERPIHKALILVVGAVLVLAAGCEQAQAPSEKKSRLIAAENVELKKQLAQRDKQIEGLRKQHAGEIERRDADLAKCRKQMEGCERELKKGIDDKVQDVLAVAMEQSAALRKENEALKAQIAELKAKSLSK